MKRLTYLIAACFLVLTACQSGDGQNKDKLSKAISKVSEKTGRDNLGDLLTEEMVRRVFDIPSKVKVEADIKDYICSYDWNEDKEDKNLMLSYSVGLNFGNKKTMTQKQINAIWESQNNGVYKEKNLESVSGVGDKASWSTLGGGQLRVASKGDLFYISLRSTKMDLSDPMGTMNQPVWTKDVAIEKSKVLAKEIIAKL